eukprot:PhF_6_TR33624/c0_g1_i1/m.49108
MSKSNVTVCVRVRPQDDPDRPSAITVLSDNTTLRVVVNTEGGRKTETHHLSFTRSLNEHASQESVFELSGVKEMVEAAMSGYACTILCYGQTGSGKTYSMTGPEGDTAPETHGLLQRAIHHVFMHRPGELGLTINVSYYEVYNEKVNDLIIVDEAHSNLQVRWNATSHSFYVEGLIVVKCETLEDVMAVVQEGLQNRKKAVHLLNEDSSRSHSIFTMYFDAKDTTGKLNFVDLAGSERIKESASNITETKSINKSLFALGKVISALCEASALPAHQQHTVFIPYRDSTLTKLLMDSLGGNCKTLMVATVNPAIQFADESLNTLKYATRMAKVTNATVPLQRVRRTSMDHLKDELETLKRENAALKIASKVHHQNGGGVSPVLLTNGNATSSPSVLSPGPKEPGLSQAAYENFTALSQKHAESMKEAKLENERLRAENMRLRQQLYMVATSPSNEGGGGGGMGNQVPQPMNNSSAPAAQLRPLIPTGKVRRVSLTVNEGSNNPNVSRGSVEVEALVTPYGVIQQSQSKSNVNGPTTPPAITQISGQNTSGMADSFTGCRHCADLVQSLKAENDRLLRALRELQLLGCGNK